MHKESLAEVLTEAYVFQKVTADVAFWSCARHGHFVEC